jgi:hypothetical protein
LVAVLAVQTLPQRVQVAVQVAVAIQVLAE